MPEKLSGVREKIRLRQETMKLLSSETKAIEAYTVAKRIAEQSGYHDVAEKLAEIRSEESLHYDELQDILRKRLFPS